MAARALNEAFGCFRKTIDFIEDIINPLFTGTKFNEQFYTVNVSHTFCFSSPTFHLNEKILIDILHSFS